MTALEIAMKDAVKTQGTVIVKDSLEHRYELTVYKTPWGKRVVLDGKMYAWNKQGYIC